MSRQKEKGSWGRVTKEVRGGRPYVSVDGEEPVTGFPEVDLDEVSLPVSLLSGRALRDSQRHRTVWSGKRLTGRFVSCLESVVVFLYTQPTPPRGDVRLSERPEPSSTSTRENRHA